MRKNMTLKEVIQMKEEYLENLFMQEKAPNTIKSYSRHIDAFIQYIRDTLGKDEFTKIEVVEYKQWLMAKYSPATINLMVSALNGLFIFMGIDLMKLKKLKQQKSNSIEN